jgi:non-heme chloroperoxidase
VRHRGLLAAGAVAAGAATAVVLGRDRERAWRAEADPTGGDVLRLPEGRSSTITTDDGAVLAVTDAGSGPLVVLAHCYTGRRGSWAPVARRLVDSGYRVVLWDQRGHGESTVGSDGLSVDRLGDDLRDVLEAIDATGAVVAGHSMGGMTIMACVGRHPDVVARRAQALVLVATAATGIAHVPRLEGLGAAVMRSGLATVVTAGPLGPFVVRGTEGRRPVWAHLEATARMYAETPPDTRAAMARSMATMDLRAGLAACPVPTMVIVGMHDRLTRRGYGAQIVSCLPDAELVVLPDAGHMLPFEEPDLLADVIAARTVAPVGSARA